MGHYLDRLGPALPGVGELGSLGVQGFLGIWKFESFGSWEVRGPGGLADFGSWAF